VANERTGDKFDTAVGVRCEYCDERIGVYEPMVELTGDLARRTSLAADPQSDAGRGRVFHATCYDQRINVGRTLQQ
jgi:hypothetical protein